MDGDFALAITDSRLMVTHSLWISRLSSEQTCIIRLMVETNGILGYYARISLFVRTIEG